MQAVGRATAVDTTVAISCLEAYENAKIFIGLHSVTLPGKLSPMEKVKFSLIVYIMRLERANR